MITFKSNKDNSDYLMIDVHFSVGEMIVDEELKLPSDVVEEIGKMYFERRDAERKYGHYIGEVAIKKDSALGQYLIQNCDYENIINEDSFIYFETVMNALNIAIFDKNDIYKKIIPLFQNGVSDSKEELLKVYEESVLDYILANPNFDYFIKHKEDNSNNLEKEYVVYEDGKYSKKVLAKKEKVFTKK